MELLFLKLIKNKAKGQKMQKNDSNNENLQKNFGLLVKNGMITTPVTNFFGTFEEFSQSVDVIFERSFPRNILEKKAKKATFPDDETIWFCLEVTNEQFCKALEFLYSKSISLADAQKSLADEQKSHADLQKSHADLQKSHADLQKSHAESLADALRERDELKKQIKEYQKNKSVKSLFQNCNPIFFAEDLNAQEDQKLGKKVEIKNENLFNSLCFVFFSMQSTEMSKVQLILRILLKKCRMRLHTYYLTQPFFFI